jgi:hypothetical protein
VIFIPDPRSELFHPGSRVKKIPDPNPSERITWVSIFNLKVVSKLSEKGSMMLIPDPDPDFLSPDPELESRVKKAPDP